MAHPLLKGQSSGSLIPGHQRVRDKLEQEKVADHSPNIDNEALKIRAQAARRTSAVQAPNPNELVINPDNGQHKFRKSSAVTRPEFEIREESEGNGIFVSGIMKEKQQDMDEEGQKGPKVPQEVKKDKNLAGRFGFMQERTRSSDGFSFSFLDRNFEKCDKN